VSQHNVAIYLAERIAENLACLLGIGPQLRNSLEGCDLLRTIPPSPFKQVNDIDMSSSSDLRNALAQVTQNRELATSLFTLSTCLGKLFDVYCATKRMPCIQVILCPKPHVELALKRLLVSVPRIV